jgi:hypothetical protein
VTNYLFLLAFVPAVALFALRAYLKTHPPSTSDVGLKTFLQGLAFGVASTFALPLIYIAHNFQLVRYPGNLPDIVFAFAGNIINLIGVFECAYKRTGPGLGVALFLVIVQLMWIWTLFGAFMMAN